MQYSVVAEVEQVIQRITSTFLVIARNTVAVVGTLVPTEQDDRCPSWHILEPGLAHQRRDGDDAIHLLVDQCIDVEDKIPGQIPSVLNVQEMTARALLVDTAALELAQNSGDVLGASGILMDASYTDMRPALAAWRESRGLPGDPMSAYAASGYRARIAAERVGGVQAGRAA